MVCPVKPPRSRALTEKAVGQIRKMNEPVTKKVKARVGGKPALPVLPEPSLCCRVVSGLTELL